MEREFRNKTAIVGVGMSEISRSLPGGAGGMAVDAIRSAVEDAGLTLSDIDGMATYALVDPSFTDGIEKATIPYTIEALGIKSLEWFSEVSGGGPALGPLAAALNAVYSGKTKYAVVYRCMYRPKGKRYGFRTDNVGRGLEQFILPYGYGNVLQLASVVLKRLEHDHGLTKEHLGEYVLHSHRQAMLNDHAIMKEEITMDEYLSARCYANSISKWDCDVPLDGATAVVVTTADLAKDLKHDPVYVSAIKNAIGSEPGWGFYSLPEYDQMASYISSKGLWEAAGFDQEELDFVQLYDGFSYLPFIWASHLGLCKPHEMGDYIAEACRKGKDADIPITTMGGALCEGRLHGNGHLIEAVRQLQGRAGERQLSNVQTGVVTVGGFNSCGVLALQK